ncbi:MAG: hypothetical protein ACO1RT_17155 [Planctomycetaceae bacterium]
MSTRTQDDDWDEDEGPDGDDDFDYEEFIENEFGDSSRQRQHSPFVRIVAVILLIALVVLAFAQLGL